MPFVLRSKIMYKIILTIMFLPICIVKFIYLLIFLWFPLGYGRWIYLEVILEKWAMKWYWDISWDCFSLFLLITILLFIYLFINNSFLLFCLRILYIVLLMKWSIIELLKTLFIMIVMTIKICVGHCNFFCRFLFF